MESKEQTGYGLLIEYTIAELNRVREVITQAKAMEAALVKSLEILQQVDVASLPKVSSAEVSDISDKLSLLKLAGYPYKGTKQEKVIFLLKKYNITMKVPEVANEIIRIEGGTYGDKVAKSLNYIMNQMVADGKLLVTKVQNSNRHAFFALPEFFPSLEKGSIALKQEHYPKEESWGKMPLEKRNFNKAKWTSFIR